ncbi:788_t:CDS:2, partial [Gigaspora rosea]
PLTEIPSVLDLYIFDITSPGGGKLCEGYEILAIREGDVKTITLVDENVVQLSDSRFAYVEYLGCSARLMNNSKILDTISNTPANQVQPTSTRFAPNLESIQNALKYNKKLCHPSISEFEKVKNTFSQSVPLSKDSYGNVVVYTMPYGERKARYIYNQAAAFALANPNSYTHLLLQVFDHQVDLFGRLSEQFFEEFVHDSLDRNLLVIKSTITDTCDSDHCPRKGLNSTNYYDISVVPESSYFESYLKHWQEPYNVLCSAKFKTTNNEKLTNIPVNAFKINKYKSVETGNVKNLYLCMGKVTSTRQIDQWLPLILVINITGINITNEGRYLENKDLPEEIEFPSDVDVKQRYRLTGVSFCDGNHHIADVRFENVKNKGWYQYDGMGKSYRVRAMYIGSSRPPHIDNYNMDY